ncbi:MAG TPA: Xaa-Pro peptidase family protein, partial [Bacteroidia bacterium]|nr:Xaa-Pro peptidase family protein [Bacteroidia bacterium]
MNRRNFVKAGGLITSLAVVNPALSFSRPMARTLDPAFQKLHDKITPITIQEYESRMEQARKLMAENKLDMVFMEGGTSLKYFTGISWGRSERLFGMILPGKGNPFFIAPKFEEGRAREQVKEARLYTWEEDENPWELIGKCLKEQGLQNGVMGIEETCRYFVTEHMQQSIPSLQITSALSVTAGCRSIKSEHEIGLMQIANDFTRMVYTDAVHDLKEGMTEAQFGKIISDRFAQAGVEGGALVLFGEASAYPHGLKKEHKLKAGDIVLIDGGCSVEGYESDVTRTTVFGKASDKMNNVWSIVRKAQDAGLKAARPGVEAQVVDAAARKVIADNGYGPGYAFFTHRLGHGIGLDGHEWYYLVGGNTRSLKSGNMFSNEPGIYLSGEFGIRIEDEMLITEAGAR